MDDVITGFRCPDDNTLVLPHGGVLDLDQMSVVFWGCCPTCKVQGRNIKVTAKLDVTIEQAQELVRFGVVVMRAA